MMSHLLGEEGPSHKPEALRIGDMDMAWREGRMFGDHITLVAQCLSLWLLAPYANGHSSLIADA